MPAYVDEEFIINNGEWDVKIYTLAFEAHIELYYNKKILRVSKFQFVQAKRTTET